MTASFRPSIDMIREAEERRKKILETLEMSNEDTPERSLMVKRIKLKDEKRYIPAKTYRDKTPSCST